MNNNIINERPFLQWGLKHEIGLSNDGEDDFVISYFKDKKINRKRVVVDIGAADGLTGSNSRKLINHYLRNLKNNEFVYVERTKHWEKM